MKFRLLPKRGRHITKDKVYQAGDIITCEDEKELGGALDKFERVDFKEDVIPEPVLFTIVKRQKKKGYDVINIESGEKVNDSALTKKEAEELVGEMASTENVGV